MPDIWSVAQAAFKGVHLAAIAAAIGGLATQALPGANATLRDRWRRFALLGGGGGLLTLALLFIVQVGTLAKAGLAGMFDPLFAEILWASAVGEAARYRGVGLILLLVAASITVTPVGRVRKWVVLVSTLAGASLVATSFASTGHTVEAGPAARVAVALHALAALWWAGSLWPLWTACRQLESQPLFRLTSSFGQVAVLPVGVLLIGGGYLIVKLAAPLAGFGSTSWDWWLCGKLVMVSGMLALALYHRQQLVPRLASSGRESIRLRSSIGIETGLALLVLVATSVLTTLVGPGHS